MGNAVKIERMDHLGIVAGVGKEIGLVEYFDDLDTQDHERATLGQVILAMILNGLGFSNRQLYLVPQFFANKPIEQLIGPGIQAEDLNDDRLGRALDWLTAHDLTALFAGVVRQARKAFGFEMKTIHVDTTSFSVSGDYEYDLEPDSQLIRITYGYSRDHREDLKQWMMSLATADATGIPVGLQMLSGNASDKETLIQQVREVLHQLTSSSENPAIYIADSGMYSQENMAWLTEAEVAWIARVPETSKEAKQAVEQEPDHIEQEGERFWWETTATFGERTERWIVVYTKEGLARSQATMRRKAEREQPLWEKRITRLPSFSCEADAQKALDDLQQSAPPWIHIKGHLLQTLRYSGRGRPSKNALPEQVVWTIEAIVSLDESAVEREAKRLAWFIVATNVQEISASHLLHLYLEQQWVERGFGFLKDPLFLASSVFVKKPERVMALGFIMVCCLLLYRLAEFRLRQSLAQREETVPNQKGQPTSRPTLRWIFQCFEGIHLLFLGDSPQIIGLSPFHEHILSLLGSSYQQFYFFSN
jgi:transposase